jgi:signal transduction histidine kinase
MNWLTLPARQAPGVSIAKIYQIESQMILAESGPARLYGVRSGQAGPPPRGKPSRRRKRVDLTFQDVPQMTQITLAASNPGFSRQPSIPWAHDIRNALATIGLHLETLERLAGPRGGKAANAALALISRGAAMCADALTEADRQRYASRRRGFDLIKTISEVVSLLEPAAPDGFEFQIEGGESCIILADQGEVFRILFNLVQNAVSVARRCAAMRKVRISVERAATCVSVRISDNGPGLPKAIKARLFRSPGANARATGFGLAIARELAERNGGNLSFADRAKGTTFLLELPNAAGVEIAPGSAMPSLGRRIAG